MRQSGDFLNSLLPYPQFFNLPKINFRRANPKNQFYPNRKTIWPVFGHFWPFDHFIRFFLNEFIIFDAHAFQINERKSAKHLGMFSRSKKDFYWSRLFRRWTDWIQTGLEPVNSAKIPDRQKCRHCLEMWTLRDLNLSEEIKTGS